jgi:hypothetical protein
MNLHGLMFPIVSFGVAAASAASEIAIALGGMLIGAGLTILLAHRRPSWLRLARRASASARLEDLRRNLLTELREIEEGIRTPPAPIRMDPMEDTDKEEPRQVA